MPPSGVARSIDAQDLKPATKSAQSHRLKRYMCLPARKASGGQKQERKVSRKRVMLLVRSIKGEVKKKYISFGWTFSCFSAHLIERDLF